MPIPIPIPMLKNYAVISIRNIWKHKLYSLINIFSLMFGLAASIVIYLFIQDELSFDAFNKKHDSLYRLNEVQSFPGTNTQHVALSMPGMAPNMIEEFPEIQNFTRFYGRGRKLYKTEEKEVIIDKSAFVDSTFFQMFNFELTQGDRSTALDKPYSVIFTRESAEKIFGTIEGIVGESVTMDGDMYIVKGVLENVSENSHLQFDVLLSITTITSEEPEFNDRWGSNFLVTYFNLHNGTNLRDLESKFPDFLSAHMNDDGDDDDVNDYYKLYLQPLKDVHLGSMNVEHDYHNYRKFNGVYIKVFTLTGIFILLIAAVNFMNLSIARATYRWKEVGVRKSLGANRMQVFVQFLCESSLLSLGAFLLAILLSLLFTPLLNQLIGRELELMNVLGDPYLLAIGLLASIILGILSGLYPSLYLSAFQPSKILKGNEGSGKKNVFQNALVVMQFGLAIAMIISTLVVTQQLYFMDNKDIGFNKDRIVLVDMDSEANDAFENLKTEFLRDPNVLGVTASGQRLGNNFHQWGFSVGTDSAVINFTPSNVNIDYDYLDVYGIKLKDGRGFSKDFTSDAGMAFVINEAFAREIGLEDPVGTSAGHSWYHSDSLGTIIGVTEDFHFNSLHYKINTLSMVVHPDWGYDELSVKISANDIPGTISNLKETWDQMVPGWPFQYSFLDDHLEELYRSDKQMGSVVTIMAILAILIACMGLFGLASITIERRIKEIGIRKVLGATIGQILVWLSKGFTLLVVISFVLFVPITAIMLNKWLEEFAYRMELSPIPFVVGGILALIIALATISYHTLKSAKANPVDALRYE